MLKMCQVQEVGLKHFGRCGFPPQVQMIGRVAPLVAVAGSQGLFRQQERCLEDLLSTMAQC